MEWVEITAKTVEAAKERALDELGIDHDEAEFVVLEEPRRGLFNQLRGTARVRARVMPRTPPPKVERRGKRGRSGGRSADGDQKPSKSTSPKSDASAPKETGKNTRKDTSKPKRATSGAKKSNPNAERPAKKQRSTTSAKPEESTAPMTMNLDEQVAATQSFLEGLLDAIGFAGTVTTERIDDANATVNIEGDDLGLLIGPRGQTMNAIQDLARIALQKQAGGSWEGHVHVDVSGYRAKRRAALVSFVEKVADEVRASGTAKALEPMSSSDRKIVHDTVNGLDGVSTSSEGHEPRRWVQISPDDA